MASELTATTTDSVDLSPELNETDSVDLSSELNETDIVDKPCPQVHEVSLQDDDTLVKNVCIMLIGDHYILYFQNLPRRYPMFIRIPKGMTVKSFEHLEQIVDQCNLKSAWNALIDELGGTGSAFLMYLTTFEQDFPKIINVRDVRLAMIDGSIFRKDSTKPDKKRKRRNPTRFW